MDTQPAPDPANRRALVALGLVCAATSAVIVSTWGWTHWDFGDGNYLYVGRRINDGLVPYRDILAPQPPLHLLTSAWSQRVGELVGLGDLLGARAFSLVVRMLQAVLVYLCAARLFGGAWRGVLAATVYLWLPIGFWWSLCMQSENLEIVFLLVAFLGILSLSRRGVLWAGAASALAMHCNMTAVPYFLVNALFLASRRRDLAGWYVLAGLGTWGVGAAATWAWCGPAYLQNVVLNQTGSFPRADILALSGQTQLGYFWGKVSSQGMNVLSLEGMWIALALGAMALRAREARGLADDPRHRWEFAIWSALGMMLSIGFTMKGGTVDYIFVLGEPAVALFGADGLWRLARAVLPRPRELATIRLSRTLPLVQAIAAVALLAFLALHPRAVGHVRLTLAELQAELPSWEVERVRAILEEHTEPGDVILAPPFYAYLSNTTVAGELAENYLWNIKVMNEAADGVEGEGHYKMREIAGMLRRGEVAFVMLDMNQTGRAPFIRESLPSRYVPAEPPTMRSRNTPLELWVPRP